ncbi:MAG: hypothetical protein ABIF19_06160 [Planctomycetota bacterium]
MGTHGRLSIASLYYYITPAFILLDYAGGINVRTAVLDGMPLYKNLYYGFCILCGVVIYFLPWLSAAVALFESIIMILMTILGIFLPYVQYIKAADDILSTDLKMMGAFDVPHVTNLLLALAIATISFRASIHALEDGSRIGAPGSRSGGPPSFFQD